MLTSAPVAGWRSDVGCQRTLNEDAVIAQLPVFAVADGMGGHSAGEVAAAIAVEHLQTLVGRRELHADDLLAVLVRANDAIVAHGVTHPDAAGLGTTISGVCLGEVGGLPHWFVFNVGDSRVYRFIDGELTQVSIDHSEVAELVAAGQLSAAEARVAPNRNVITRSLGSVPRPAVDVWMLPADPGDRFVVCSDGLTNEIDDDELGMIVARTAEPQATADELVRRALAAGARDNVSVLVVHVPEPLHPSADDDDTKPRGQLAGVPHV